MTENEFTQNYLKSLQKVFPNINFKILGDLTISADYQGKEFKHFLENAFKEYKMEPDSIQEITMKYVNSSLELYGSSRPINVNRIVPIIKPIDYLDDLKQISKEIGSPKDPWIVYEKYNDDLIIVFGEDTEKSISYFTKDEFNELNIDRDSLLKFSKDNLLSILPDIQKIGESESYGIACGGDYETSLILINNLWIQDNFKVDGDFIIAIPNRDLLFITGSNNKTEIERIAKIALETFKTGNHPISPYLFKWTGDKFERY